MDNSRNMIPNYEPTDINPVDGERGGSFPNVRSPEGVPVGGGISGDISAETVRPTTAAVLPLGVAVSPYNPANKPASLVPDENFAPEALDTNNATTWDGILALSLQG